MQNNYLVVLVFLGIQHLEESDRKFGGISVLRLDMRYRSLRFCTVWLDVSIEAFQLGPTKLGGVWHCRILGGILRGLVRVGDEQPLRRLQSQNVF